MKKILFASLAVLTITACSHSEFDGPDYEGGKLTVTGSVNQIMSRASGAAWDKGDQIGLSSQVGQDNVMFVTTEGDGVFTSAVPVYVLGDGEKTYTAYYPYESAVNTDAPEIVFSTPKDFMWATATATRENPHAAFVFKHKMSKISFTITDNTPGADATGAKIKLEGIKVSGKFHTLTGDVSATDQAGSISTGFALGTPASIILPVQDVNATVNVMLAYNGKTYGGGIQLTTLAEGTEYHYTIDLTSADPASELSISSATITDWNKNEGGNVDVTETETPKEPNILEVGDFLLKDGSVIDKNDRDLTKLKAQIIGVVYYVGNPQPSELYGYSSSLDILRNEKPECVNGLAIAITDANEGAPVRFATAKYSFADWYNADGNTLAENYIGTNLNLTAPGERMLGYNNTRLMKAIPETETTGITETMTILDSFESANPVANSSGWYVPSYAEIKQVIDNYDTVLASITKAGGSLAQYPDFGTVNNQTFYWTSDMRGNSYNWVSPMLIPADDVKLFLGRNSNGTTGYFRFSIAF